MYEIIINLKYFVKLRVVKYFWNLFYINFGDKMRKIKSANNLLAKKKKVLIITMLLCLIGLAAACKDDDIINNGNGDECADFDMFGYRF